MKTSSLLVVAVIGVLLSGATLTTTSGEGGVGFDTLKITVAPQQSLVGSFVGINATYTNLLDVQQTGIAIAPVHNSMGQTVAVFAGTFMVAAGRSSTVYIVFYPWLLSQTYSVQVFVVTPQGGVISVAPAITVTT